jgi:hypothetical protein
MNQGFTLGEVELCEAPKATTSFDFNDPCSYQTFQNEYKERAFDSWGDAHDVLSPLYPKVIGRVVAGRR